ncbi:hypothetical protein [Agathobaculum massiliense]|uniref:hypothetical protein n=1 Tax=Agathobaculum massiliense TaxID=3014267 RepID=UPI000D1FADC5|nr:hypothetical protein [Agathobaculum massiliense]
MSWTNAAVTAAGHALQAALVGTGKGLVFTRAASGAGLAAGTLEEQTAVTDERQALSLQPAQVLEGAKVRVRAVLVNTGLSAGYTMRQLGFYARAEDSGDEVLYALVQDEAGDPIPAAAESPGFSVDWTYVFSFGNAAKVTVELDPAGVIGWGAVGQPDGVAGLGPDGKVPEEQLPDMTVDLSGDKAAGILPLAKGGTGASAAQGARTNLEVAKPVRTTVSFPTAGWTLSGSVYTQTVSCSVAKAAMKYANIGPQYSTDASARKLEQEAYALIAYVDTADGQLVATCWGNEKPAVNLTLIFEGGVD